MQELRPPPLLGFLFEGLGLLELPRLLLMYPYLSQRPSGEGAPVMVLPGFGAGDESTALLRHYIQRIGYRARGWGLGYSSGDVPQLIPRVIDQVASFALESGSKVRLIGWSLGGYLAREVARERPDLVHSVITLGSPVIGGPKYTAVAQVYRQRGFDVDAIETWVQDRNRTPLEVPVTAIYSRLDGIVSWQACIDEGNKEIDHVEVRTTHLGFGFSPHVYRIIAEKLSRTKPAAVRLDSK
jgi:pimeloyl-ACP methyl ester carboxylesterase